MCFFKYQYKCKRVIVLLAAAILAITGCSQPISSIAPATSPSTGFKTLAPTVFPETVAPTIAPTVVPTPTVPKILSIEAVADPSLAEVDVADPYAQMNKYAKEVFKPDRELYNTLYRAVDGLKPSVDISSFKVDKATMLDIANCLYNDAQYGFYYLQRVKLSKDGKKAVFTYNNDTKDTIIRNKETFYARLSHLVYNVVPEGYTDLQKVLAVYQYLCENSNYSSDMQDPTTCSPYGILTRQQGICGGYASLAQYTLSRRGVTIDYVCNEAHAWNVVMVGGKQYQMDITFGAGQGQDPTNSLKTVLMDDQTRLKSLSDNNIDPKGIILGYPGDNAVAPSACTDTSMAAYNKISFTYALDIDQNRVYFADEEGIKRMNLDCTGLETLAKESTYQMVTYDGVLYYIGGDNGSLYKLAEGKEPELLDGTVSLTYLKIIGGSLVYGVNAEGSDCKTIPLNPFDLSSWEAGNTVNLPVASVPRSHSFAIKINFSESMDKSAMGNGMVYLADAKGNPLAVHLIWSEDGKTLTVRPKDCVADLGSVTLYVKNGVKAAGGGLVEKGYTLRVDVAAGE